MTTSPFIDPSGPLYAASGMPSDERPAPTAPEATRPLDGRLAVVTGATGLLGATVAAELVRRGARVCLLGRSIDDLRETARRCGSEHSAVLRCDLTIAEEVDAAADFVERIGRPVDVLVHAAGVNAAATVASGSLESLDEHYLLNVRGPYLLTQRLLGSLAEAHGQVVVFASASVPDPIGRRGGDAHGAISSAALLAFADQLRVEAADDGVRVLTVDAALDVDPGRAGDELLDALAGQVIDALGSPRLDVTGFSVRSMAHPSRSVRQ